LRDRFPGSTILIWCCSFFGGTQTISTSGSLRITGGSASGQPFTSGISHNGSGLQKISAAGLELRGGTTGSGNAAVIGSNGGGNLANAGDQRLDISGDLVIAAGAGGDALINGGLPGQRQTIYARDIFHLGETGLALMMGTAGAGALIGALLVAYLGDFRRKGWFVLGGAMLFGICITNFALTTRLALSLTFLFGLGFALVVSVALINTLLQKLVTDQMRGRVMSMFILSFLGTMPIGNIIAGAVSSHFGPQSTLAVGGLVVTVFAAGVAVFNKRLRELH